MKLITFLFTLPSCCWLLSCQESTEASSGTDTQVSQLSLAAIERILEDFDPMFQSLTGSADDLEYLSYEMVADLETGAITLLNFRRASLFPIAGVEEYARLATVYTVECNNGETTIWTRECNGKFSCGNLIKNCLEQGGCAMVCESPSSFEDIRENDLLVLNDLNVSEHYIDMLLNLPPIDLQRAAQTGTVVSVQLYRLLMGG